MLYERIHEKKTELLQQAERSFRRIAKASFVVFCVSASCFGSVNVYLSGPNQVKLQTDLIASLTNQFQATITPGFFANSFTVNISSENAPAPAVVCGGPCALDQTIQDVIAASSITYAGVFGNGMDYETSLNLSMIGNYDINCSSPSVFSHNAASGTYVWDPITCEDTLSTLSTTLYQQSLSTPTIIPGF